MRFLPMINQQNSQHVSMSDISSTLNTNKDMDRYKYGGFPATSTTWTDADGTVVKGNTLKLRKDFVWGYATGGTSDGARGESIWDAFTKTQKAKIQDGSDSDITCDSYHLWREDVDLLKRYKATGYRFSLSWPRIIPLGGRNDPVNVQGIKYYNDLIDALLKAGIKPYVTLYHWDFPQALQDRYCGWTSKEAIQDFSRYAEVCFEAFGDRVKNWTTINEPYVAAIPGWYNGDTAPGRSSDRNVSVEGNSDSEPWIVGHNLMLAHAHAAKVYHRVFQPIQNGHISITLNGDWAEPWDESEESKSAVERKMAVAVGWFADPIYLGRESPIMRQLLGDRLPRFTEEEWELLKDSSDFYGCNTYTTNYIKDGGADVSTGHTLLLFENKKGECLGEPGACDWLVAVPWGFRKHLNYLYKTYRKPILVTECGYALKDEHHLPREKACHDVERANYFIEYLDNLLFAVIEDGVDVRGFFGWTLLDNWEWAEGYIPRFGVTYVDFETRKRYPKLSSRKVTEWFAKHLPPLHQSQ